MTVNVILVLGISLFAFSAGTPNCSQNACADLWVARDCDKVQDCIENEWSKLKPTGRTDSVCDICLKMVQEARTTLESNDTEEALKQVLEGSCKLLVLKPAVEACDRIMDQLVPQLVAVLASEMDPETVCTVAKLCNNDYLRALQKKSKECTECKEFMAGAKDAFTSVSEKEFQEGLVSVCRNTGSYSDACYGISATHSALLYNHTRMALNGTPCAATLLCPSPDAVEDDKSSSDTTSDLGKTICPMCVRVSQNIIQQLTRAKSFEDYQQNLVKGCTKLSFPAAFCSEAAKSFRMYNFLKENGEAIARAFCRRTICSERRSEQSPIWPLLPLHFFQDFPAPKQSPMSMEVVEEMILRTLMDFISEDGEEHVSLDTTSEVSDEEYTSENLPPVLDCETCKSVMRSVCDNVQVQEEKFSEASNRLCANLPRESRKMCRFFVQTHGKEMKEAVSQRSSPDLACAKMSYCSPEKTDKPMRTIAYGDPIENPVFLTPLVLGPFQESDCEMCRQFSRVLANYVNSSNGYMKQALGVACLMKKNLGKCSNFLESYSPDVARAFAEYVSSEKICQDVTPSCEPKQPYVAPKTESRHLCRNCKTWVDGVTSVLLDDKNMEMIKATFALPCDQFPEDLRRNCRQAVNRNAEQNLANILERLSPDETCRNLKYCPRTGGETTSPVTAIAEASSLEKVPCKFCLLALKTLLDQLENDKTEEAIRSALRSLCKYFPEETRDTCRKLIDEYSEDIIDMIIADFNPSEICIRLKMCKPNGTLSDNMSSIRVFDVNTNEIHDLEELPSKNEPEYVSTEAQVDQALLQQVHSAVQECALCEALVQVISSHQKMLVKDYDFYGNASIICRIVPRYKRKQCMSMVVSYGPSIVNLIVDKKVKPNDVCPELTLCDPSMHARVDMPVSVPEPKVSDLASRDCLKGPSFWCVNEENARKCGTLLHCREIVWKTEKPLKKAEVSTETP